MTTTMPSAAQLRVIAVRKASKARLLADFARAARLVRSVAPCVGRGCPSESPFARAYVLGAVAVSSATLAASLLTAFSA